MRRVAAFPTLAMAAALLAAAATSDAGGLDLRIGAFVPRAESNLFADAADLFGVDPRNDFTGVTGGIEYNGQLAENVELAVSIDGFGRTQDTSYREFVRDDGTEIQQTLRINTVPIGLTLRLVPTSRRGKLAPYLGVGADLIYWRWREIGEFIDFRDEACLRDEDCPIFDDSFRSDGWTGGFHVSGGLRVALNRDFAVVGEARYQWAKTEMGDDFAPTEAGFVNEIDLSGLSVTVGFHVRF